MVRSRSRQESKADRLGSNTRQTSTAQGSIASRQYDAFGNLAATSGTWTGPFGFAGVEGYQEDSDSGLQLLGHRYYDSSTGRFLTRDPIKDGRNWYGYVRNNPHKFVDPLGLWGWSFNLGGQLIIGIVSVSVTMSWTVGSDGTGVGVSGGFAQPWHALGAYAGLSAGVSYDDNWSATDSSAGHQKGYATGVSTPIASSEYYDSDENASNGGISGGGASIGPGYGGGVYQEQRQGGFLPMWTW